MKLKITLLISLTFLMVACPSKKEDLYINFNTLNIEASCSTNEDVITELVTCEDNFKIYLDFESSLVAKSTFLTKNIGAALAVYEPVTYLQNKVEKCVILNTNEFDSLPHNTEINSYFTLYLDDYNWINDLSMIEGINESVKIQYKNNIKPYLNLNENFNYSGKFILQLKLTDGTLLVDSTENIVLKKQNN